MMYEMLAGEQPFRGEQPMQIAYQHANDSVPTPSTKNPDVPAELDELVLWATAREPNERPRDARVMLEQVVETQNQLRTALPTASTTVIQRTTVLPAALSGTGDQTTVIRPAKPTGPVVPISDATAALTLATNKRHSRAWWWVVLFILVAGLAGGTGWYFGAGPGSTVTIPQEGVVGQSPDAARAAIVDLGLTVSDAPVEVFDPVVPAGTVAGTDPATGTAVSRASVVTLQVSKGPEPIVIPEFSGLSEQAAKDLATATGFPPTDSEQQFSADVAAGVVLAAYGVDDAQARVTLTTGETYFDQRPVTFLVSAGPVPSVAGLAVADAVAKLEAVGLTGVPLDPVFDSDVPAGQVVRIEPQTVGSGIGPGDSVNLVVSKGPELVLVPEVTGMSQSKATAALEAVGLVAKFSGPLNGLPGATVRSIAPEVGAEVEKGSTVTVKLQFIE
jgi:beta-lactam-binding protein with PASTA domain